MSAEAHYFRVGLFVLLGVALAGSCTVVLGGGQLFQERRRFETYFNESVQGLDVGSPVMLRGVRIGQVASIGFVTDYYDVEDPLKWGETVSVLFEVVRTSDDVSEEARDKRLRALVAKGMRLRLSSNPLTGQSFLQADFLDPERFPQMEIAWTPRNFYVPSAPSLATQIKSTAERLVDRLDKLDIEGLVSNLNTLVRTSNDKIAALDVRQFQNETQKLVKELRLAVADGRQVLADADVAGISVRAKQTLDDADTALVKVESLIEGSRFDIQTALENLRVASDNLRDLSATARDYPSLLLLGEPPPVTPPVKP